MPILDVAANVGFSTPFRPRILHTDDRTKVVLVCLEPGQGIPAHPEENQAYFHVLEGSGVMLTDEGDVAMKAGNLVTIPRGGVRGIRAGDGVRLVVLAIAVM